MDEATGYQDIRPRRALAEILEQFIDTQLHGWTKAFPDEFFAQVCRLKEWDVQRARKYPKHMGNVVNEVVYVRLAPGVLDELRRLNPMSESGRRDHHHHQHLTRNVGYVKLQQHLAAVIAMMKTKREGDWQGFVWDLNRVFPIVDTNLQLWV